MANVFILVLLVQPSAAAESLFDTTVLQLSSSHLWKTTWNSLSVYVAIQPCSLDSLYCLHFNYSMQKESKMGERGSKMGKLEKQNNLIY